MFRQRCQPNSGVNYATACINVIAPTNVAPVAGISNLVNQITDANMHLVPDVPIVRDGLFVLTGSAYLPGSTNSAYALHVLSPTGDFVQDLTPLPRNAFGFHSGSVTTGTLATCDFTLLRNGVYQLELIVQGNYQQANATVLFRLESDLKIGQFSFSEQDMVIPVSGIPLTIIRTYDSLKANSPRPSDSPPRSALAEQGGRGAGGEGDFGAGWTFAINDVDMQIDVSGRRAATNPSVAARARGAGVTYCGSVPRTFSRNAWMAAHSLPVVWLMVTCLITCPPWETVMLPDTVSLGAWPVTFATATMS